MARPEPLGRLDSIGLLGGTRVTVLGRGLAAATAAEILRVVGAEVTRLEVGAYEVDLGGLAGEALVVCDIVEEGATAGYGAAVAARSGGAWVTVSAFGLDGPKGGEKGSDLVCAAAGGLLQSVADPDGGVHAMPGGQALRAGGQAAALAALHGLSLVRVGHEPVHLDVSVQEAVTYCAIPQPAARVLYDVGSAEVGGFGVPQGRLPCADGEISILVVDDHQWNRLVEAMGRPAWTEAYPSLEVRRAHADVIEAAVAAWTAARSKFEVEGVFQAHGVAACATRTLAEVVANEQFLARDFLRPRDDGRLWCATFPALTTALGPGQGVDGRAEAGHGVEGRGEAGSARTLAGLRIAELTNVLTGPLAGATLAAMGAVSVRFEEPQRLDLYRRNGPFQSAVPGEERAAYYLIGNFSKRNVSRRVGDPAFATAVNVWADLVLENVGGGRLERLGLAPPAGVDKTLISMSGFGRTGPAADYKAYANSVQGFAGMAGAVRQLCHPEAVVGTAIADCNIALWAATLAAAWWLGGAAAYRFDLSMIEVVAANLNGLPLDVARAPAPARAPDLILRCVDGSVAVATGGRPYARALAALGLDPAQAPVRVAYAEAAADLRGTAHPAAEVVAALAEAGFAAYRSLGVAEVVRDAQLEGRGFVVRLPHPEVGVAPIFALPWKEAGTRRDAPDGWYRRSALLGEDDDWFDEQLHRATTGI
jgi:crotonobetainyl-CoA:carnitine CoA-transferase CaiB-like acyl-CoA transferase